MVRLRSQADVRNLLNSANNLLQGWIAAYGFTDIDGQYATDIDNEMNKHLWYTLNKLGWRVIPKNLTNEQRQNLASFRWNLLPKSLNGKQREKSGVSLAKSYLDNIRKGINSKDKALYSQYWLNKASP
jgi:hypothetical protein